MAHVHEAKDLSNDDELLDIPETLLDDEASEYAREFIQAALRLKENYTLTDSQKKLDKEMTIRICRYTHTLLKFFKFYLRGLDLLVDEINESEKQISQNLRSRQEEYVGILDQLVTTGMNLFKILLNSTYDSDEVASIAVDALCEYCSIAAQAATPSMSMFYMLPFVWDTTAPLYLYHGTTDDHDRSTFDNWRNQLMPGDLVDAMHEATHRWAVGQIIQKEGNGAVKVRFRDFSTRSDSWFYHSYKTIAPVHQHTLTNEQILELEPWRKTIEKGMEIDVNSFYGGWFDATVIDVEESETDAGETQMVVTWKIHDARHGEGSCLNSSLRMAQVGTLSRCDKASFGWGASNIHSNQKKYGVDEIIPHRLLESDQCQNESAIIVDRGTKYGGKYLRAAVKAFADTGGFEAALEGFTLRVQPLMQMVTSFLSAMSQIASVFGRDWLAQYVPQLIENFAIFTSRLEDSNIRAFTPEAWNSLGVAFKRLLLRANIPRVTAYDYLEKLSLTVALDLFKSTMLTQRIMGMKAIEDACKAARLDESISINTTQLSEWLRINVIESLFDPKTTHKALLKRSPEVLRVLLTTKDFSKESIDMLWSAVSFDTGATDADTRTAVFDAIKATAPDLPSEVVGDIIAKVASVRCQKLPVSAIELIHHMASHGTHQKHVAHVALQLFWHVLSSGRTSVTTTILTDDEFASAAADAASQLVLMNDANVKSQAGVTAPPAPNQTSIFIPTLPANLTPEDVPTELIENARKQFIRLIKNYDLQQARIPYAILCVQSIRDGINCPVMWSVLWDIIDSYNIKSSRADEASKSTVATFLEREYKLVDVLVSEIVSLHKKAAKILTSTPVKKVQSLILENEAGYEYKHGLKLRMDILGNLLAATTLTLSEDQAEKIWTTLHTEALCDVDANQLMRFLQSACRSSGSARYFNEEVARNLFSNRVVQPDNPTFADSLAYFACVRAYFLEINQNLRNLDRTCGTSDYEFLVFQEPEKMVGTSYLWNVALETASTAVAEAAIDFLLNLYTRLAPNFDENSTKEEYNKANCDDAVTNVVSAVQVKASFVDRCMAKLRQQLQILRESKQDELGASNIAQRCVLALHRLLAEADAKGHGGLRPHYSRTAGDNLHLKFCNSVPAMFCTSPGPANFELSVPDNFCVWDLREAVANRVNLKPLRVKLICSGQTISDYQNSETLRATGIKDGATILVNYRQPPKPSEAALIVENVQDYHAARMTPAVEEALAEIFSRFSSDGQMSQQRFKHYILACGVAGSNIHQSRVDKIFEMHETTPTGELTQAGFIDFYREACVSRPDSVRKDLRHHGYDTRTLRLRPSFRREQMHCGKVNNQPTLSDKDPQNVLGQTTSDKQNLKKLEGVSSDLLEIAEQYGVDLTKEDARQDHLEEELEEEVSNTVSPVDGELEIDEIDEDVVRSNPRLVLTLNPTYFDALFDALEGPTVLAKHAWELLQRLPTNPLMFKRIEHILSGNGDASDRMDWPSLLSSDAQLRSKLLYALQIIESMVAGTSDGMIVDIKPKQSNDTNTNKISSIEYDHTDTLNDSDIAHDVTDSTKGISTEGTSLISPHSSGRRMHWRRQFVITGGLYHLHHILQCWDKEGTWKAEEASNHTNDNATIEQLQNRCLSSLIAIIRLFLTCAVAALHPTDNLLCVSPLVRTCTIDADLFLDDVKKVDYDQHTHIDRGDEMHVYGPATRVTSDTTPEIDARAELNNFDKYTWKKQRILLPNSTQDSDFVELMSEAKCTLAKDVLSILDIESITSTVDSILNAVADHGTELDAYTLEHACGIWLTLCVQDPSNLSHMIDTSSMQNKWLTLLRFPSSSRVRFEIGYTLYQMTYLLHSSSNMPILMNKILLDHLRTVLGDSTKSNDMNACANDRDEQYFLLLNRLLRELSSHDDVQVNASTSKAWRQGCQWLTQHKPAETRALDATPTKSNLSSEPTLSIRDSNSPGKLKSSQSQNSCVDRVLIGVLELLNTLLLAQDTQINGSPSEVSQTIYTFAYDELLDVLLNRCLFFVPKSFADLDESKHAQFPLCKRNETRAAAFHLLSSLCDVFPTASDCTANLLQPVLQQSIRSRGFRYTPSSSQRSSTGYVGLRNLGCICYMNAMLQQLFMIPRFRYGILDVPATVKDISDEYRDDININGDMISNNTTAELPTQAESTLFQLQRLFGFLALSERQDYNPRTWCNAFRPLGEPVNVLQQQDAEEFVTFFMDMVENVTRGTRQENLIHDYLTGSTITQIVDPSTQQVLSEREEPFHHLTLTVKNHRGLREALHSFMQGEEIEDYLYEPENRRMTITRRNRVGCLPANLVLHCKRFEFNFETFQVDKVNSRFEFPLKFCMYPYTREGATVTEDEIDNRQDIDKSEYEYVLAGVVCHVGSAGAGHYYSFIRDRISNVWLEFNDSNVRPFDINKLERETFGGEISSPNQSQWLYDGMVSESSRNAYLLVYEKVVPQEGTVYAHALECAIRNQPFKCPRMVSDPPTVQEPLAGTTELSDDEFKEQRSKLTARKKRDIEFSTKLAKLALAAHKKHNLVDSVNEIQKILDRTSASVQLDGTDSISSIRNRDKIQEDTDIWNNLLPNMILQDVFEDNVQHILDQSLFCENFFLFMERMTRRVTSILIASRQNSKYKNVSESEKTETLSTQDDSYPSNIDSVSQAVVKMFGPYALSTLSRSIYLDTYPRLICWYSTMCESSVDVACTILKQCQTFSTSYTEVILECSSSAVRKSTCDLVVVAVKTLCQETSEIDAIYKAAKQILECRTRLEASNTDQTVDANQEETSQNKHEEYQQTIRHSLVATFIYMHLSQLEKALDHTSKFEHYFTVISALCDTHPAVREFLICMGAVEMLIDIFMGKDSPFKYIRPHDSNRPNKSMKAPWSRLLHAVSLLIRSIRLPSCVRRGTGTAHAAAKTIRNCLPAELAQKVWIHDSPTGLPDPYIISDDKFPAITDEDQNQLEPIDPCARMLHRLLNCSSFFENALKNDSAASSTTAMLQHLCWENPNFSNIACSAVSYELTFSAQYYMVDAFFDVVHGLLTLNDSLQARRIAMCLGDPHTAMRREGYVGIGFANSFNYCKQALFGRYSNHHSSDERTVQIMNRVNSTLLLNNVTRGLLSRMYSRRYSNEKWVYACLDQLILLMQSEISVLRYIWSIPPQPHLKELRGYQRWADWMVHWLFRYAEGTTACANPDQNHVDATIQSLKQLMKLRDQANIELNIDRPSFESDSEMQFYVTRLKGNVISHSYSGDVTCTSHTWIDDEGIPRMAFKVVNDKRQSMTFSLHIDETPPDYANFEMPKELPMKVLLHPREVRYLYPVTKRDPNADSFGSYKFNWRYELAKDEEGKVIPPDIASDEESMIDNSHSTTQINSNDQNHPYHVSMQEKISHQDQDPDGPLDIHTISSRKDRHQCILENDNDSTNAIDDDDDDENGIDALENDIDAINDDTINHDRSPFPSPAGSDELRLGRSDSDVARELQKQLNGEWSDTSGAIIPVGPVRDVQDDYISFDTSYMMDNHKPSDPRND